MSGASRHAANTGADGKVVFRDLPPGGYSIEAGLDSGVPIVDAALLQVGSTSWAVNQSRPPLPAGTNKCNLFVFETANGVGQTVPMKSRFSFRQRGWVDYAPLAGQWADSSEPIGAWRPVLDPLPGDVIAEAHFYVDATGHVGIVAYPEPVGMSQELMAEQTVEVDLVLSPRTISAASNEVLLNDWGWRSGQHPRFRRYVP